jgi:hypothetical protein
VAASAYGQLPLAFEANQGQAPAGIDYVANGSGSSLDLTSQAAVLTLGQGAASSALSLRLAGANPAAQPVGLDPLITRANYLTGSDPSQWHTDIPTFGRVQYHDAYLELFARRDSATGPCPVAEWRSPVVRKESRFVLPPKVPSTTYRPQPRSRGSRAGVKWFGGHTARPIGPRLKKSLQPA